MSGLRRDREIFGRGVDVDVVAERAADRANVPIDGTPRCFGIELPQGFHDSLMFAGGSLRPTRQVHHRIARLLKAVVEVDQKTCNERTTASLRDRSVESNVQLCDLRRIGFSFNGVQKCLMGSRNVRDAILVLELNSSLGRKSRQRSAHFEHVHQFLEMDVQPHRKRIPVSLREALRYEIPATVLRFDESHADEALDPLSHGQPADPEQLDEFWLGRQTFTCLVHTRRDCRLQLTSNPVGPRAAW